MHMGYCSTCEALERPSRKNFISTADRWGFSEGRQIVNLPPDYND